LFYYHSELLRVRCFHYYYKELDFYWKKCTIKITSSSEFSLERNEKMPTCQNCGFKWSWWDTVKIGFKNNKNCSNCHKRQFVSPSIKMSQLLIYFFPFLLLVVTNSLLNLSDTVLLSIGFILVLVMIATMPYKIKLTNEQKPLW